MSQKTIWWLQELFIFAAKVVIIALVLTLAAAELIHIISSQVCN